MLVVTRGLKAYYQEALRVLGEVEPRDLVFPLSRFRFHAASALILADNGDTKAAKENAIKALNAAGAHHSGFRYHAKLGLVGDRYKSLRKDLAAIAGS